MQVVGFSPERRVTEVQYSFDVRVNGAIQRIDMSRSIESDSGVWYQNAASAPFGSAFKLDQLFGVVGSTAPIEAVTITLRNTQGSTTSSSVPFTGKMDLQSAPEGMTSRLILVPESRDPDDRSL